eukprot:tig00021432_g21216.t1
MPDGSVRAREVEEQRAEREERGGPDAPAGAHQEELDALEAEAHAWLEYGPAVAASAAFVLRQGQLPLAFAGELLPALLPPRETLERLLVALAADDGFEEALVGPLLSDPRFGAVELLACLPPARWPSARALLAGLAARDGPPCAIGAGPRSPATPSTPTSAPPARPPRPARPAPPVAHLAAWARDLHAQHPVRPAPPRRPWAPSGLRGAQAAAEAAFQRLLRALCRPAPRGGEAAAGRLERWAGLWARAVPPLAGPAASFLATPAAHAAGAPPPTPPPAAAPARRDEGQGRGGMRLAAAVLGRRRRPSSAPSTRPAPPARPPSHAPPTGGQVLATAPATEARVAAAGALVELLELGGPAPRPPVPARPSSAGTQGAGAGAGAAGGAGGAALLRALERDPAAAVRRAALELLPRLDLDPRRAIPALVGAARDRDPRTRTAALAALAAACPPLRARPPSPAPRHPPPQRESRREGEAAGEAAGEAEGAEVGLGLPGGAEGSAGALAHAPPDVAPVWCGGAGRGHGAERGGRRASLSGRGAGSTRARRPSATSSSGPPAPPHPPRPARPSAFYAPPAAPWAPGSGRRLWRGRRGPWRQRGAGGRARARGAGPGDAGPAHARRGAGAAQAAAAAASGERLLLSFLGSEGPAAAARRLAHLPYASPVRPAPRLRH